MKFIEVIQIDEKGNVEIPIVVNKETFEESEYTKFQWEGLFLKPKWSFRLNKWIETATDDELNPPDMEEELSEVQQLAQALTELELDNFEKDNRINELEKENQLLGQESTDHDLRLIELEEKLNV
ncbi:hypothetical protein CKN86_02385 [Carnobacterium divergens]|uniref:hypothetical protein n=1 Tax=Carnobacterium divergens TaxID=2748 RepID=UPI000D428786|nr:hypothetical protein [Carnobacterium divergens]MCO6018237.1 hypothetical protein [Carnobacterium divergens]TFI64633.1 hypothetical protein CKN62_02385 [Carnobacterium divergens]TFI91502.1 hypothetical protein CKN84_02385 [Carnobacterium divergens]TFJ06558.1 hypothetical protein CKN86_02385 [Carnobacterium divergens]TFJ07911.1 hypothetical protein CKN65_02390 [Carnobacterium divergens]